MAGTGTGWRSVPDRVWWPLVAALTAIAFALRLKGFQESPAGDELYLLRIIDHRSLGGMLHLVVHEEKTPPLGFLLSWLSIRLGPAEQWMRLPSLIAGSALVPIVAVTGRRIWDGAAGLAAGALAALSPFLLFYGIESRSYALAAALTAASLPVLLAATERGGWTRWASWSGLALSACLTHYTVVFVLAVEVIWVLVARPASRRSVAAAATAVVGLFLIWLPFFSIQFGNAGDEARRIALGSPLSLDTVSGILARVLVGHPLGASTGALPLSRIPGTAALAAIIAGILLAAAWAIWRAIRRSGAGDGIGRPRGETVLLVALALAAPVGLILASIQPDRSLLLSRNLITSLPPLLILVGALLTRGPLPVSLVATAAVTLGLGIGSIRELTQTPRPDLAAAAKAISARWQPGDVILEAMYFTGPPLDRDLAIHLPGEERRALVLTRDVGQRPFGSKLLPGRSIFTVAPGAGYTTIPLGPPNESAADYRLVWSRQWRGVAPVLVAQWQRIR